MIWPEPIFWAQLGPPGLGQAGTGQEVLVQATLFRAEAKTAGLAFLASPEMPILGLSPPSQ